MGVRFDGVWGQDVGGLRSRALEALLQLASWGEKVNTITVGSEINMSEF